jgi:hypothetical protein
VPFGALTGNPLATVAGMAPGAVVASMIEQHDGESSKAHSNGKTPAS